MTTISDIFDSLAADNSRLAKEAILKQNKDNKDLQRVIKLALDPLISFYIRKIPAYTAKGKKPLSWAMDQIEQNLQTRNVTGNAAIELLKNVLESLDESNSSVIEKIIAKDLRCGVSEATANKIWPKLVSTYPVMLASGFDQKLVDKIQFPAYCQLKLDGMRFNAIVKGNTVEYRSRNGKELFIPSKLFSDALVALANYYGSDYVFDGELLVVDSAGKPLDRKTGNGILSKGVKGTMSEKEADMVRVTLWDAIPYTAFSQGTYKVKYEERFAELSAKVDELKSKTSIGHFVDIVWTKEVKTQAQAQSIFEKFLAEGQEGTILKSKTNIWEDKRSKEQIKFKGELECDLAIVGVEEGTGKNEGRLGAIVCEGEDDGKKIRVNVGSGFTDDQRDEFWTGREDLVGQIVEIRADAATRNQGSEDVWSLRFPRFLRFRGFQVGEKI